MIRVPCSECESVDFPKHTQKKKRPDGSIHHYMASFCVKCYLEKRRIYKARNYEIIMDRMKIYMVEWEKNNKDKRSLYNRKYRNKIRRNGLVECYDV